jgi:hypothetical protein
MHFAEFHVIVNMANAPMREVCQYEPQRMNGAILLQNPRNLRGAAAKTSPRSQAVDRHSAPWLG